MRYILPLLILLAGCATVMPHLPGNDQLIRDVPIVCGDKVLYWHVYDTDPGTEAGVMVSGLAPLAHDHGERFLVIIVDADGRAKLYLQTDDGIKVYTDEEWRAKFGSMRMSTVCDAYRGRET